MVEGLGRPTLTRLTSSLTSDRRPSRSGLLRATRRCGAVEALRGRESTRDQIRDQDATGRSGRDGDGCDVDGVASMTNGDGGDGPDGLRRGSPCS
jgi:hypothetical protein